ncbi:MAG: glutaredoxin family protein [Thiomonas sp.]
MSAAIGLGLWSAGPAWAIYKIIGPDGSVTFSDLPPSSPQGKTVQSLGAGPAAAPKTADADFPPALRDAARKYPVTLYTTPQCDACDAARDFLQQRGIPFTEKTVTSNADIKAYKALSQGSDRLPLLAVGNTRLPPGFSSSSWGTALDVAGYPKTNVLPRSYARPKATELVPPPPAATGTNTAPGAAGSAAAPPVQPPPNPNAPKGFRF